MRHMSWWKLYDYFGFGWFGKASEELTFEPSPEWAETDLYRDELSIPGRGDSRCQNPNCILDESEGQENVNIARTYWEGWKKRESEVTQLCPTLCDPVDCSLPGSSIHRILQARILEWVSISFSRGSSQPRDRTRVSRIGGRRFNLWATGEALSICISFLWLLNILPQTWRLKTREMYALLVQEARSQSLCSLLSR